MTNEQIERLEHALLSVVENLAETATTAEKVQALAAVAGALIDVHNS